MEAKYNLSEFISHIYMKKEEDFLKEVKEFYLSYQPVARGTNGASFVKAQCNLIKELKEIATNGLRNSLKWHQRELINYANELITRI